MPIKGMPRRLRYNPLFSFYKAFSELTRLSTHDWKDQHFLGSLNLRTHKLEVSDSAHALDAYTDLSVCQIN